MEEVTELYHPLVALEKLRRKPEDNHFSIIGINGCRIDTSYRATGGYGTYLIENGKQAKKSLILFEPTQEINKLCLVNEHITAYDKWLESLKLKGSD